MDNASPRVTFSSSCFSVDISPFTEFFVLDEGVSLTTELAGDTETCSDSILLNTILIIWVNIAFDVAWFTGLLLLRAML
uniref:Guanine nucleotide-exchange, putative n=1 Tax=Arundo donax TaxID=35708 RepID=A0A0A9K2G9_ARUDO